MSEEIMIEEEEESKNQQSKSCVGCYTITPEQATFLKECVAQGWYIKPSQVLKDAILFEVASLRSQENNKKAKKAVKETEKEKRREK